MMGIILAKLEDSYTNLPVWVGEGRQVVFQKNLRVFFAHLASRQILTVDTPDPTLAKSRRRGSLVLPSLAALSKEEINNKTFDVMFYQLGILQLKKLKKTKKVCYHGQKTSLLSFIDFTTTSKSVIK